MPILSVIVPVYNGEGTIRKCIDSLLGQSLDDIEIIVVNDGSTDNTADIVNLVSDSRIKLISYPNSGQGIARNRGIKVAVGKYVGFVDADDTVHENMYGEMVAAAEKHSAQMVQCAINDIKADGITKRPDIKNTFVDIKSSSAYARDYFYSLIHTNEVCNKIYLKSVFENSKVSFDNTFEVYSEDMKLNIDILPHLKRVYFMEDAFYNYYISEGGHCLKNPEARLKGIYTLYKRCTDATGNKVIKGCIQSMAVINLLSYTLSADDGGFADELVSSAFMKKCMLASAFYKKTLRHALLMLALILLPLSLKKKLIKKHYSFE